MRNSFYRPIKGVTIDKVVSLHGYYYDEEKRTRVFGVVDKKNVYEDIQSHLCECDNEFVKQHLLEHGSDIIPPELFGDCVDVHQDLLESINRVRSARDLFNALPANFREKYGNDMERFALEFNPKDFEIIEPITKKEPKEEVEN